MQSGPEQLRDWMQRRGVNQQEAAALLGFVPSYVSQLLSGRRNPGLDNAVQIERTTGIAIEAWLSSALHESPDAKAPEPVSTASDKV